MRVRQRVWCWVGILFLIAFLGSGCIGGTDVQPIPYSTGTTEVDLEMPDTTHPARYSAPRHVSQYRYDGTEVDLATPLPR